MRDAMPWMVLIAVCCIWPGLWALAAYAIGAKKLPISVTVTRPAQKKQGVRPPDPISAVGSFKMLDHSDD